MCFDQLVSCPDTFVWLLLRLGDSEGIRGWSLEPFGVFRQQGLLGASFDLMGDAAAPVVGTVASYLWDQDSSIHLGSMLFVDWCASVSYIFVCDQETAGSSFGLCRLITVGPLGKALKPPKCSKGWINGLTLSTDPKLHSQLLMLVHMPQRRIR